MLGRLVLIGIQIAAAWYAAPFVLKYLPPLGELRIFAMAAIFALIVYLIGVVGHFILKDVAKPTPSTLAVALVFALLCAGLTLVPDITSAVDRVVDVPRLLYPLIGAVVGYAIKR